MARRKTPLEEFQRICLELPDTKRTDTWGKPHFRVGEKIFAGCHDEDEGWVVGFKLEKPHAAGLVKNDPRFTKAPYVGHAGWVSMRVDADIDWTEVAVLVRESYGLIAPKRSLAKMGEPAPAKKAAKKRLVKKGATNKAVKAVKKTAKKAAKKATKKTARKKSAKSKAAR